MIELKELIDVFSKLPGIGKKSAGRISYYLLKNKENANELSRVIKETIDKVKFCSLCGNFTINDPCGICSSNERFGDTLCIVEDPKDLQAIEDTGCFKGKYHVLMGAINPMEGIGPEKLRIKELIKRVEKNKFSEILIATNPTIEGEATFLYLTNILTGYKLKLSRLATGIPMGGSLEYSDKLTLSKALQSKHYL